MFSTRISNIDPVTDCIILLSLSLSLASAPARAPTLSLSLSLSRSLSPSPTTSMNFSLRPMRSVVHRAPRSCILRCKELC